MIRVDHLISTWDEPYFSVSLIDGCRTLKEAHPLSINFHFFNLNLFRNVFRGIMISHFRWHVYEYIDHLPLCCKIHKLFKL